jgi:hypothetical protein
MVKSSHFGR